MSITLKIDIDTAEAIAVLAIRESIERLQRHIDANADAAINGELADDIQLLWHLMHTHNYICIPAEHYDVPA